MCQVLEVSRCGYYSWLNREPSPLEEENKRLLARIQEIYYQNHQTYGSPRIYRKLRQQGYNCSKKRVERIMREVGLKSIHNKKYKVTTDSGHSLPVSRNIIEQNFNTTRPDQLWVTDITYIPTREGWLYLSAVMDVHTRKIIGWAMDKLMTKDFTIKALKMALKTRRPSTSLIHHSDRGSQYASHEYQEILQHYGIESSMSRKGNCWDNAVVESFFKTLKVELIHRNTYKNRRQAAQDIFEYIEIFYNRERLHSAIGYTTPESFEKQSKVA